MSYCFSLVLQYYPTVTMLILTFLFFPIEHTSAQLELSHLDSFQIFGWLTSFCLATTILVVGPYTILDSDYIIYSELIESSP